MIEPAFLLALEPPAPPAAPPIVEERLWLSPSAEQVARNARRLVAGYEAQVAAWLSDLGRARAMAPLSEGSQGLSDGDMAELTRLIEDFEALAETRATERTRAAKGLARTAKSLFKSDPATAAIARSLSKTVLDADDKVIGALLDYALFLRAFRAERSPASRGGRTFGPDDDLVGYLERELA